MLFDLRNNGSVARNNPAHSMTIKFVDIVRRLYDDQQAEEHVKKLFSTAVIVNEDTHSTFVRGH